MQKVFIVNFNSLYEILDEIKENLSFKIVKLENEIDLINNSDLDIMDFLIISKENILNLNDLPLILTKLLQLVNIRLMKLKFNHQSKITINGYELNINSKFFSKNDLKLKLTEKEIEIILYLYNTKTKHDVADLQKHIWHYSVNMETHTVETHIYRLRKKISDLFKDENFILSHKNGYFIE